MAKLLVTFSPRLTTTTVVAAVVLFLACFGFATAAKRPSGFLVSERPAPVLRREKLSHFRFYWHDIVSGPNPTAVPVARAPSTNASATAFGMVVMIDDPLTEGPELRSSKQVGRAQGMYASASQSELGLMMAMNFAFTSGKYNGSTLTVLGRNAVFSGVREMPVIGGSGLFRFARGYCQATTHKLDLSTGDAVVQYNLFVMHY